MAEDIPPPVASPRPPGNPPERTQTGEFRAAVQPMLDAHDNKLTLRSVFIAVASVAMGTVTAIIFVDNRVQAQTDAGIRVHEERITTLEHQQTQLQNDVHEVQADIRSLYKAVMTGRPQERLEKPPPSPDGGR